MPRPKIGPEAALVRIGACGVCGTDLHILKGHWPKPLPWPFTLGHELAGVVVEIGEELTTDFMGKPIGVGSKLMLPPLMPCGRCDWCLHHPETANKCLTPVYYGRYLGFEKPPHLWGGFSQYVYLPWNAVMHKIPDTITAEQAGLVMPLSNGIEWALLTAGIGYNDTVLIQGPGQQGLSQLVAAKQAGASKVIVSGTTRDKRRFDLAMELGADEVIDVLTEDPREKIMDLTDGRGLDYVLDCTSRAGTAPVLVMVMW